MSCGNSNTMANYFPAQTMRNQTTTPQAMWNPPGIMNVPNNATTIGTAQMSTTQPTSLPAPLPDNSWMPETLTKPIYTPAFLLQNIGSLVRVEFLIGNQTTDRVGVLSEVGASFIVLQSLEGSSRIMCDIYSIRFVTIISRDTTNTLINTYGDSAGVDAGVLMAAAGR